MTLAIVSALPDELAALQARLDVDHTQTLAGRTLHRGRLAGHDAILVLCGVGKVAAATTTALLLDRFDVGELLFTGVAGGIGPGVAVGDVVVADTLLQHDMDASPLFPRWEVPLTGLSRFAADGALSARLARAARRCCARPRRPRCASSACRRPGPHRPGDQRRPFRLLARRGGHAAGRAARRPGRGDGRRGGGPGLPRLRPALRGAAQHLRPRRRRGARGLPRFLRQVAARIRATSCWRPCRPAERRDTGYTPGLPGSDLFSNDRSITIWVASMESPGMERIWLKHYPEGVPADIDVSVYPSLVALLEESFRKHAALPAYRFMGKSFSYAQVDELSRAFAAYLQASGLQPGDRVAVMMPNVPQYPVVVAASCARAWWWSTSTRSTPRASWSTSSRTPAPSPSSSWRTSPPRCRRRRPTPRWSTTWC
jgi:hypothetical protein